MRLLLKILLVLALFTGSAFAPEKEIKFLPTELAWNVIHIYKADQRMIKVMKRDGWKPRIHSIEDSLIVIWER
jgi:hypothetical protein